MAVSPSLVPGRSGGERSNQEGLTVLKGLLAGGVTLGVAAVFPEALVLPFLVAVLGFSSGVYPGLAMANPEHGRPALEWVVALMALTLGLVGLFLSPLALIGAWIFHALWSLAHQVTGLGDGFPEGYPATTFAFGLVMAGFLLFLLSAGL